MMIPMGAADYRRIARQSLAGKWGISILVTFVAGLLGGVIYGSAQVAVSTNGNLNFRNTIVSISPSLGDILGLLVSIFLFLVILYALIVLLVGSAVELGLHQYNMRLILRVEQSAFRSLFSRFNIFGRAFGLRLLIVLKVFAWTLLFIVPGFVAVYRYAMAPYILSQYPETGIAETIERSKEMMQGKKGELFYLHLTFIGWSILCRLTCGIGFLWLQPYISAATAAFYLNVSGQLEGRASS